MFDELFNRLPSEAQSAYHETYQSPVHHAEGSLYNHSKLVAENLPSDDIDFQISALLHDYGKIPTTQFVESDKYGIKVQSINHENKCPLIYLQKFFVGYLINWNKVEQLCKHHMRAHLYTSGELSNSRKRKAFEQLEYFTDIIKFAEADSKGRLKENGLPFVVITIGIPGSGKFTWVKRFTEKHNYTIISPDSIRKELTGNISDQNSNQKVWELAYSRLKQALDEKKGVVFYSTMCNLKSLKTLLTTIKDKAIPCYKYFDCSVVTAIKRIKTDMENNIDRSIVPNDIVERMEQSLRESVYPFISKGNVAFLEY